MARVEAFIAGHGLDEALQRAEAYRNAGKFPFFWIISHSFAKRFVTLFSSFLLHHSILFTGADAILMHSKKSDPSDIESFMKAWKNQASTHKAHDHR